jgi:hypothetical protein
MYVVGRAERALLTRVTDLATGFPPAWGSRGWRRWGRRVGGARFRGGTRTLAKLGLQFTQQGFEFTDARTLGAHAVEQAEQGQLASLRQLGPVVGRNAQQVERFIVHSRKDAIRC